MKKYVVNVISTNLGSHELHIAHCSNLPEYVNELGEFENSLKAIESINKILPLIHICPLCIPINEDEILKT